MPDCLRTGSLGLDILLGGGWKPGTINEIWGTPGSGKTTLAQHAVWELDNSKTAMWMSLGAEVPHRPSGAMLCQPRNAEQAFFIMSTAVMGDVSLIVVDSANGLVRQAELDGNPDYLPHPQREYRDELNRLKDACEVNGAIVLFLSKPRDKDRQPVRGTGISEKAKDRVHLDIAHQHQDETREIQAHARGTEAYAQFRIEPGSGIDWAEELARLAVHYELVHQRRGWFDIDGWRVQGSARLADHIENDTMLALHLDTQIRAIAGV